MKKLRIIGLTDPQGTSGAEFTVEINPEQIKHGMTMEIREKNVGDTSGPVTQYESYGNDTIDLEFYLDNTGAIPGSTPVEDQIEKLGEVAYDFDGSIHKPKYLLVDYGTLVFRAQLKSLNVDYTLFDSDGFPLRAKVSLSFTGHKDPEARAALANKSSPDMTHAKTIREGDSLPLLCKEVYGDMGYYLQVAEHNGLTNFRELEIGSTLEFPPLER